MTWLLARIRCWRIGHDWYLMTTDGRVAGCHCCPKQSYGAAAAAVAAAEAESRSGCEVPPGVTTDALAAIIADIYESEVPADV